MYLIEYAQFRNRIFTGWVDAGISIQDEEDVLWG